MKKTAPRKELELIGRELELARMEACLLSGRSVLLEGPVGVGKTRLALSVCQKARRPVFRVDGDSRYTEQKLSGWFDPPSVLKKGFIAKSFIPGPLVEAMQTGGILFINELNRLPEGVQNVLLPALDEKTIVIPRLGQIRAKPGFLIVATQNPKEFVATSHLSEAILDRFELVLVPYQDETEERAIVHQYLKSSQADVISTASVRLIRETRNHPRIRRGGSVRAAIAVAELTESFLALRRPLREAFIEACLLALPTRLEIEREGDPETDLASEVQAFIRELAEKALSDGPLSEKKK